MNFTATVDNVIISVKKKIKNADELLIDTGEKEQVLLGSIVAVGPKVHTDTFRPHGTACVYLNRVALLPWETDTEQFYVVKEENIYGILGK
jgi:co-chaperonin GroES (HSP10)